MTIPANLPAATTVVLAMPDPTDTVTAEVFARWVDSHGPHTTFFTEDVIDGPDVIADTVQRAVSTLKEYGFGVTRDRGTLRVTSPIPDTAPTTLAELAARIDPQAAQLMAAAVIAEYSRHTDGWNGGDAVAFIGDQVSGVVEESLRPLLCPDSAAVVDYWNRIAGQGR